MASQVLGRGSVEALIATLDDADREVRVAGLHALVRLQLDDEAWKRAGPKVIRLLETEPNSPGFLRDASAVPVKQVRARMRVGLESGQESVRRAVVEGLARAGDQAALPAALELLGHSNREQRIKLAKAMTGLDVSPKRWTMRRLAARDAVPEVRLWSALALAEQGKYRMLRKVLQEREITAHITSNDAESRVLRTQLRDAGPLPVHVRAALERASLDSDVIDFMRLSQKATKARSDRTEVSVQRARLAKDRAVNALRSDGVDGLVSCYDPDVIGTLDPAEAGAFVADVFTAMPTGSQEVTDLIARSLGERSEPIEPDVPRLFTAYRRHTPVDPDVGSSIAWTASRAGVKHLVDGLDEHLSSAEPEVRKSGALFLADAAARVDDVLPPEAAVPVEDLPLVAADHIVDLESGRTLVYGGGGGGGGGVAAEAPEAEAEPEAGAGRAPAASTLVTRTPHIDVPEAAVQPASTFTVTAYADSGPARAGEEVMPLVITWPEGIETIDVEVTLLGSSHFVITRHEPGYISLRQQEARSTDTTFSVTVRPDAELEALGTAEWMRSGTLTAVFTHGDRPAGSVTRRVQLASNGPPPDGPTLEAGEPPSGGLELDPFGVAADLLVRIVADEERAGAYLCEVRTNLVPLAPEDSGFVSWRPGADTETLVTGFLGEFTDRTTPPSQLIAALKGAGLLLFRAAPKNFQRVFWQLVDAQKPLRTIAVVSAEPYFPWELMVPNSLDRDEVEERDPLGVDYALARWTDEHSRAAPQVLPLGDSYAIAPTYAVKPLPLASVEAELVVDNFAGSPVEPAEYPVLEQKLCEHMVELVHFAGHGSVDPQGKQTLLLDNDSPLSTTVVEGAPFRMAIRVRRPVVFLNACEAGRAEPSLTGGLGGFCATFVNLGASGVIAPLWSVKDEVAHEVASVFYAQVMQHPEKPFAEILQELRARSYHAEQGTVEDSYAAYMFYGDPLASRARPAV